MMKSQKWIDPQSDADTENDWIENVQFEFEFEFEFSFQFSDFSFLTSAFSYLTLDRVPKWERNQTDRKTSLRKKENLYEEHIK